MPLMTIQSAGPLLKDKDGKVIGRLPPKIALCQRGPVIQVAFSLSTAMATAMVGQGDEVPKPISGFALLDTGASHTCIDDDIAKTLQLPAVDKVNMCSASHASTEQNVYPVHIELTGTGVEFDVNKAMGATLKPQGIDALIGRDVLQNCMLVYNGPTGQITLAFH